MLLAASEAVMGCMSLMAWLVSTAWLLLIGIEFCSPKFISWSVKVAMPLLIFPLG